MSRLEQFLEVKNSTETSVDLHFYGDMFQVKKMR